MEHTFSPQEILQAAARMDPDLAVVMRKYYQNHMLLGPTLLGPDPFEVPELPDSARLPEELAAQACPWLDRYIEFSRLWSPCSFDGFHEACGLWLLSTIAARRVKTEFGRPRYTPLFVMLAGRSSLYTKSTTVGIVIDALRALHLEHLLAPDQSTPQKFLSLLASQLPGNYDQQCVERKERIKARLGLRGARGWFYEEFGGCIKGIMQPGGTMAEFRNILRKFDDCPESYEIATHARDLELIEAPYLALLGNITPADLRKHAQRGSELWSDGFLARFAIVCPGPDDLDHSGRFPKGIRRIPDEILKPLKTWDARLGKAEVTISPEPEKTDQIVGADRVQVIPAEETRLDWPDEVDDAYYRYFEALRQLTKKLDTSDLDASYVRFPEKAMRIAVLIASLQQSVEYQKPGVKLRHWARAQAITERWRRGLHALYEQVNQSTSNARENEEKVLRVIRRHGPLSPAEVGRLVRGLGALESKQILDGLVLAGVMEVCVLNHTQKYRLLEQ